jgi:sensor histidine kinase YesM
MYYSGVCFKAVYILMLVVFLIYGVKNVIRDHQASLKNKKLKEELEQSRITVMLSQIQPHFLYNSLTSVMDLCDVNPKLAKNAIADFADFLRGNLSSLKTEKLIPFSTELEHIKKYLSLEKLRFQEELEVVYDINTEDFVLPVLSVQPLVENAVKHGVGKKIGGGTVTIHTSESESHYIIRISDDGVGFVVGGDADHDNTHVGIDNTKRRLDLMIGGDLEIESEKGKGTTASILIPKRRE